MVQWTTMSSLSARLAQSVEHWTPNGYPRVVGSSPTLGNGIFKNVDFKEGVKQVNYMVQW